MSFLCRSDVPPGADEPTAVAGLDFALVVAVSAAGVAGAGAGDGVDSVADGAKVVPLAENSTKHKCNSIGA